MHATLQSILTILLLLVLLLVWAQCDCNYAAIVEYVRDGSTVRVELLETHHNILFKVAGVQSPVFKKGYDGYQRWNVCANASSEYTLPREAVVLSVRVWWFYCFQ